MKYEIVNKEVSIVLPCPQVQKVSLFDRSIGSTCFVHLCFILKEIALTVCFLAQ